MKDQPSPDLLLRDHWKPHEIDHELAKIAERLARQRLSQLAVGRAQNPSDVVVQRARLLREERIAQDADRSGNSITEPERERPRDEDREAEQPVDNEA